MLRLASRVRSLPLALRNVRLLATAALEDPLAFPVDPVQVEAAYNEMVSGKGYYILQSGFSAQYAKAARDRIMELVKQENSKATHFTGLHP